MNNITKITLILIISIVVFTCLIKIEVDTGINYHEKLHPELYRLPSQSNKLKLSDENINKGYLRASQSKIAICCLARNNTDVVAKSRIRFEHIGSYFKEYKIVLFENDSSDNTRNLLKNWEDENENVILLDCCKMGSCDCKLNEKAGYSHGTYSSKRLGKMARFRQQYLDFVNHNLSNYDYMLVIDFDLDGNADINGLFDSIAKDDWGAIFCNGRNPIPGCFGLITIPYDSLAYIPETSNYDREDNVSSLRLFYKNISMEILAFNNHFGRVKSAFNGYGLYKIKVLENCSYIGNDNLCEHINLAKCINDKEEKLFINGNWYGYFNRQGDNPFKLLTSTPPL